MTKMKFKKLLLHLPRERLLLALGLVWIKLNLDDMVEIEDADGANDEETNRDTAGDNLGEDMDIAEHGGPSQQEDDNERLDEPEPWEFYP
ncbi:hypothetical protein E2562_025481 [Oryza meyeriana var. granulata]|uniref:Uncharacterized protein n=1 Tax=Oryza meyeriana var. granulata TaxID=110450 RepID=A0A6G1CH08_9ORYZ|nr:hypothetical protein E2562_025481 [Oryza meyeriana var. granulata]